MKTTKKLMLVGCVVAIGYALIVWARPRYVEVAMRFSYPLPNGDYVVGNSDSSEQIKIKDGRVFARK